MGMPVVNLGVQRCSKSMAGGYKMAPSLCKKLMLQFASWPLEDHEHLMEKHPRDHKAVTIKQFR